MVLLRKKKEVVDVKDFQPISLIHTLAKLVARTLVTPCSTHASVGAVESKHIH
jgi:hypothetical protein